MQASCWQLIMEHYYSSQTNLRPCDSECLFLPHEAYMRLFIFFARRACSRSWKTKIAREFDRSLSLLGDLAAPQQLTEHPAANVFVGSPKWDHRGCSLSLGGISTVHVNPKACARKNTKASLRQACIGTAHGRHGLKIMQTGCRSAIRGPSIVLPWIMLPGFIFRTIISISLRCCQKVEFQWFHNSSKRLGRK